MKRIANRPQPFEQIALEADTLPLGELSPPMLVPATAYMDFECGTSPWMVIPITDNAVAANESKTAVVDGLTRVATAPAPVAAAGGCPSKRQEPSVEPMVVADASTSGTDADDETPPGPPGAWKSSTCYHDFYHETISQEDWAAFWATVNQPLPSSFRINASNPSIAQTTSATLSQRCQQLRSMLEQEKADSARMLRDLPQPISWYPLHPEVSEEPLAWRLALSTRGLASSVQHEPLRHFLMNAATDGAIVRQEEVSMIPPLLLQVESHHAVLDMCAAPGSKTTEVLDLLLQHHHQTSATSPNVPSIPTGFVLANDADCERCFILTQRVATAKSPCVAVCNVQAQDFPLIPVAGGTGIFQFDRILCDVPCSGDGTIRKTPALWSRWSPEEATNLHGLQLSILRRGLELLKVGGILVYSTCSMNPVEDEAVVAAALQLFPAGALTLRECSLPKLVHRRGTKTWPVHARQASSSPDTPSKAASGEAPSEKDRPSLNQFTRYTRYTDVPQTLRDSGRISATMFPPSDSATLQELDKCIRVLPHLQNTGGFFLAVFQKHAEFGPASSSSTASGTSSSSSSSSAAAAAAAAAASAGTPPRKNASKSFRAPQPGARQVPLPDELVAELRASLGQQMQLASSFPLEQLTSQLSAITDRRVRHVHLASKRLAELLRADAGRGALHLISAGLSVLELDSNGATGLHHLEQSGIATMRPFLGEARRIEVGSDTFAMLLRDRRCSMPASTRRSAQVTDGFVCVGLLGGKLSLQDVSVVCRVERTSLVLCIPAALASRILLECRRG